MKKFNAVEAHSRTVRPSTILSSVSAIALCCLATQPAMAQDANTEQADEADGDIIVTGIRQSIKSSQEIKRNADTFVDSITAEDIGALPDRSVNETLQRIPGVAISRFAASDDPDHFSAEGSGVVIRGLTFVRSELNGRDTFSANNGRALGFNDVSPELLGAVNVFKQQTADMIEGGLAGTVDLRTRKPFDNRDLVLAGSIEANYSDLREKWSPTFSLFGSNVFESGIGDIGIMLNYSRSELFSRVNGTQVADYTFRTDVTDDNSLALVPRGAGVRSQDFERVREAYGGALQWEAVDGSAEATIEYLKVNAKQAWTEFTFEPTTDQAYVTTPFGGSAFTFGDDRQFTSGFLTNENGGTGVDTCTAADFDTCYTTNGFQHTLAKRSVEQESSTEDISLNFKLRPTDRLSFNFDAQYIKSRTENLDISLFGSTFANSRIDFTTGEIPNAEIISPTSDGSSIEGYFTDPANSFYRAAMDHLEDSEGEEFAFRADVDYEFDDDSFIRKVSAGGRFATREQTTRFSVYNWGVLSEVWSGNQQVYFADVPSVPTQAFEFPNFQRGDVVQPQGGIYYGGDLISDYRDGTLVTNANAINSQFNIGGWQPLAARGNVVDGGPYTQGEINDTREDTFATYLRLDFGSDDIFGGMRLAGNIGLRYVNTKFQTRGGFQAPTFGDVFSGTDLNCTGVDPTDPNAPAACSLTLERRLQAAAFANGAAVPATEKASFDNWLPSLNLRLAVTDEFILRFGISRGISRPDLGLTRNFLVATSNINNLVVANGDLATGPLFTSDAGNPNLRPVQATNIDLSAEYYFSPTGSITVSAFYKDLKDVITQGSFIRPVTNSDGVTADVLIAGPSNAGDGTVKGIELAYSHFFDFLPGPLSGLGFQGNYTYVDASRIPNPNLNPTSVDGIQPLPTLNDLPLQNLSKHNFNAALLYEKYGVSARVAYSWRSKYLLATRDVIFPFSPIQQESAGQLDASLFYAITDNIKIGAQAVNLLSDVTKTSAYVDVPDGSGFDVPTLTPRSYFQNDRRFTFVARFSF